MKKFLISIDTEGDNLWSWKKGDEIRTENAKYLMRFQDLCNQFGFIPTYLTNYEMITDETFCKWLKLHVQTKECEVGMHLHAWSTPPYSELHNCLVEPAQPYLIEFPIEEMERKISTMTYVISERLESNIVTHRAGRWAMDNRYFDLIAKYGYKVDCSVTPHIDWSKYSGETVGSKGSDYSKCNEQPHFIDTSHGIILEIPVTIRESKELIIEKGSFKSVIGAVKRSINGQKLWLRPNGRNLHQMMYLVNMIKSDPNSDYLMFMLHSSEFMPGGSPTFKTQSDIDSLYAQLNVLFKEISNSFEGCSIGEYGKLKKSTEIQEL